MTMRREPNPLRPYYPPAETTSTATYGSSSDSSTSLGASARNILADIDYGGYGVAGSTRAPSEVVKELLEQAVWRYTSIFLAQPFEVAKVILQVHAPVNNREAKVSSDRTRSGSRRFSQRRREAQTDSSDSDSDLDSTSYFTSNLPERRRRSQRSSGEYRRRSTRHQSSQAELSDKDVDQGVRRSKWSDRSDQAEESGKSLITLKSDSAVLGAMSSVWQAEGAWGTWKATNCTYIYSIMLSSTTAFIRSFFAALLDLPDSGLSLISSAGVYSNSISHVSGLDLLASSSPLTSFLVAVSAVGAANLLLAPLDTVKTRLILTPTSHPPRSIWTAVRTLSGGIWQCALMPATLLHSLLPAIISSATPLLLRSKFNIDPYMTPTLFSTATFCSQLVELAVKLPFETILRRGQLSYSSQPTARVAGPQTVVPIGPYRGIIGTAQSIIYQEGVRSKSPISSSPRIDATDRKVERSSSSATEPQEIKGQGWQGLYRGWRVGVWGLVGIWGAAAMSGLGSSTNEF